VVKLRSSVLAAGEFITPGTQTASQTLADVYLVDETGRSGPHVLSLALRDAGGQALWSREVPCTLHGGDVFGEPLATELQVAAEVTEGPHVLAAELRRPPTPDGKPGELVARADEPLWVVDWRSQALPVKGAVLESGRALRSFFQHAGRPELPVFFEGVEPVDYVLVGDFDPEPREVVPAEALGRTHFDVEQDEDVILSVARRSSSRGCTRSTSTARASRCRSLPSIATLCPGPSTSSGRASRPSPRCRARTTRCAGPASCSRPSRAATPCTP
jgi:hypothetical protein